MSLQIASERPDQQDVVALIEASDAFAAALYPPEGNFGTDLAGLCRPDITFMVARYGGSAVGCGAIKWFGDGTGELKRIFVSDAFRGKGAGRFLMEQLVGPGRGQGT